MDNVMFAFNVVAPLFALMAIGYWLNHVKLMPDEFVPLANRFCFRFALPVLIFKNITDTDFSIAFNGRLVLYAIGILIVLLGLGVLYSRLWTRDRPARGALIQCFFRSNFILYGIPVAESMLGQECVSVTSMLIAIIIPFFNCFAVIVLAAFGGEKKPDIKKTLLTVVTNPLIIAALAGIIVSYFKIPMPSLLSDTIGSVSKIATPLMLMVLGANFKFSTVRRRLKCIIGGVLGRIIIAPAIVLGCAVALGFTGNEIGALVAFSASPVAASSYIMADEMGCDGELAGQLVVFTTLFSVATVFLFVLLLRTIGVV